MGHKFRYNNTTYSLFYSTSRITTPSLCHRENGTTYYVPLLTSRSQTIGDYVYNASSPTRCCRYNNKTYYAAKSRTFVADISAGTYYGQAAYNLFKSFIANNGYRILANSCSITHMGTTRTFSAGTKVWLMYGYSGKIINLVFQNTNYTPTPGGDLGVSNNNGWWNLNKYNNKGIQLRYNTTSGIWSSNTFTLQNGIKFN